MPATAHNHTTRDIKVLGQCPGCDQYRVARADRRIELSWYEADFSEHYYVTVDGIEVHRVLTQADAARLARQHRRRGIGLGPSYQPGDTYHGFDSQEEAQAAGRAVALSDGSTKDDLWPRFLVHRIEGQWTPITDDAWYAVADSYRKEGGDS